LKDAVLKGMVEIINETGQIVDLAIQASLLRDGQLYLENTRVRVVIENNGRITITVESLVPTDSQIKVEEVLQLNL
jgi:uncharacterized protein YkvS